MARYAAFLRGINVGGHKPIKMAELTEILTGLGLENVKTYIQSGNFVCDAEAGPQRRKSRRGCRRRWAMPST